MPDLFRVVTLSEAKAVLAKHLPVRAKSSYSVKLDKALGQVVAEDIFSPIDLPEFRRSTMDGFAVRAADTFGASESIPVFLQLNGEIKMGSQPGCPLECGQAARIATGGMLPDGSDAVVMLENTEEVDTDTAAVIKPVAPGENVIQVGEDLTKGSLILPKGHRLRSQDLGALAAVGINRVDVFVPYRVGIISTGDELVPPDHQPQPGQVRDINSVTLAALTHEAGGIANTYGIVGDNYDLLRNKTAQAAAENDIIILSGGSSVGTRDLTAKVLASFGQPGILFHGIALQPGKPTLASAADGKLFVGLPGHPVSAMVIFLLLLAPILRYQDLTTGGDGGLVTARLAKNVPSRAGREDFVRVRLLRQGEEILAEPIFGKSGLISTMVQADGLVRVPPEREGLNNGEPVRVVLF